MACYGTKPAVRAFQLGLPRQLDPPYRLDPRRPFQPAGPGHAVK